MNNPNAYGYTTFLLGVQNGRMGEMICLVTHPFHLYCRIDQVHTVTFAQLKEVKKNFLTRCEGTLVSPVDLDFVRGRVGCCIDRHEPRIHKGLRCEVPQFWKSIFEGVNWKCHPVIDFDKPKVSRERTLELCRTTPEIPQFRMRLPVNNSMADEIHALSWSAELTKEERLDRILGAIRNHPEDFWAHEVAADIHLRLFDLAYLYDLRGDSRGKELARIADDLYHQRHQSAFGQWFQELIARDIESTIISEEECLLAA